MQTKNSQVFNKTIKKIQSFYFTNNAFILFVGLTTFAMLLQVILFMTGNLSVNKITAGSENAWIFWLVTTVSYSSSVLGLIGNILVARENKIFIYFSFFGVSLNIVNALLSRSIMISITMLITLFLTIHRFLIWNNESKINDEPITIKKETTKQTYLLIISIWLIVLSIALTIVGLFGSELYDPNGTGMRPEWTWWADAISSSTIILSMLLVTTRNKWGFLVQSVGTLIGVAVFIQLHQFIMLINLGILTTMSITTFLAWFARDLEK